LPSYHAPTALVLALIKTNFTRTQKSLFQQHWIAKRLTSAYHGDIINEKTFKRWYLPTTLPRKLSIASMRSSSAHA
jgi:hypothetical protein